MEQNSYIFNRICTLTGIEIFHCQGHELTPFGKMAGPNPIRDTPGFCGKLMELAGRQEVPLVYQDAFQVLYACIKENGFYLFGPIRLGNMGKTDLYRYDRAYGIRGDSGRKLPLLAFSKALALVGMSAKIILGREYTAMELIQGNHMGERLEENIEQEQLLFQIQEEEGDLYHHTYQEENDLLACIREGRVEDALRHNMRMDVSIGRMSKNEQNHWKSVVTVAIALCTRAAIEGGLSPKEAYQLSDFYLQKSDACKQASDMIALRNQAVCDLTERVRAKRERQKRSSYVEQCQDYVSKHYREKIYLEDMAKAMGVSGAYLSHLFSRETGVQLQNYITQFRVDRAANLLIHSDETIARIAEYVNFPSQSYMGKVFKRYMQMTPRAYRERYKAAEFISKNRENR